MAHERVLIVGADPSETAHVASVLDACGHEPVVGTAEPGSWPAALRSVAAAIADVRTVGEDATDSLLTECRKAAQPVPCLVAIRDATVEETVAWMRRGAYAVISLPARRESVDLHVGLALHHRDLSIRNAELERSLQAHERLAMIGKLAAGVAHELNNPLDGVLRYVNLSIDKLPKDAPQVTYLIEARRGLRRMADIVRDLLQFSRNANVESTDEDAQRLARDAFDQVVAANARDRRIETVYDFPQGGVHLPRGMFQVFGNLAKNAVDAMPKGGRLTVSARLADGRVQIAVTDTGTGIPDEIRERIFEPFFTTKEVGRGTGLGLPICQRIVERLGGTLSLESEVGMGTTVRIDLPARRAAPARPQPTPVLARAQGVF